MNLKTSATAPARGDDARARRWSVAVGWCAVAVVLAVVHVIEPDGWIGLYSYLGATVGAGVMAWVFLFAHDRPARRGLGLLAAGVTANGIAEVVWEIIARLRGEPDASVADLFWLASYVLVIVAVLGRTGRSGRWRTLDADAWIDLVAFGVIALLLIDQIADIGAMLDDQSVSAGIRITWTAYPVLDALLLATLLSGVVGGRTRSWTGLALVAGATAWLLADVGYLLEEAAYTRWFDAGWMLGACAMTAAIALPLDGAVALDRVEPPVRRGRILLSLGTLLVPAGLEIVNDVQDRSDRPWQLGAATVVLVLCAALRATRLMRARDQQQERLAEREHYHRVLANNSSDAVVVVDQFGRTLNESAQLAEMFAREDLRAPGADLLSVLPAEERPRVAAEMQHLWNSPGLRAERDVEVTDAEARQRWFRVRTMNLREDPSIGGLILNLFEVTDRKRAEIELAHQAFHDSLTGLPNRALFNERVDHRLRSTSRSGRGTAVIFLDVDGFKSANDRFGHGVGDLLLREVADRLSGALREGDTVARIGGDEFAILIECTHDPVDEATTAAERVLNALSQPFPFGDQHLALSASIGVAVAGPDATGESLLRDADIAMYRSKAAGKARWTIYDADMRAAAIEQTELRVDLEFVIERGQLRLEYQPVVRLDDESIVGFEALVRWDHPTRGPIPPTTFIPIAESSGSIITIGEWVLNEACRTAARWQETFPRVCPTMSVNLSARQLADPRVVFRVATALDRAGLDPAKLVLEMTESVLVEDPEIAAARLSDLRRLGVRLAIDDFGTGYSSLSYLRQFPVDIIKIDRSFINAITDRSQVPAIVRGLLDLGRTLELSTVAEGIEQHDQLATLRDEHCEFGQGFLFAHPLSRENAEQLIGRLALHSTPA